MNERPNVMDKILAEREAEIRALIVELRRSLWGDGWGLRLRAADALDELLAALAAFQEESQDETI